MKLEEEALRKSLKPEEYKDLCETLNENSAESKQNLSRTKRKKFNYLKYNRENLSENRKLKNNNTLCGESQRSNGFNDHNEKPQWKNDQRSREAGNRFNTVTRVVNTAVTPITNF